MAGQMWAMAFVTCSITTAWNGFYKHGILAGGA
jgi:hypothetical protein